MILVMPTFHQLNFIYRPIYMRTDNECVDIVVIHIIHTRQLISVIQRPNNFIVID